ncbi:MAG TPA: hypothetical protein DD619_05090 [Alphaproteobacteria bacterium]|nr:hypothetical protein [Alphaproteobacteria bacterium]
MAQKYGLSPRDARNFSQMTEEQRLMYLFSRLEKAEKSNKALSYNARVLASEAEDARNAARQKTVSLNRKIARLEREQDRKY